MLCFNHQENQVIGVFRSCGRGICLKCEKQLTLSYYRVVAATWFLIAFMFFLVFQLISNDMLGSKLNFIYAIIIGFFGVGCFIWYRLRKRGIDF